MNDAPAPATPLSHSHVFNDENPLAERNAKLAFLLTVVMMVAEIAGGSLFNSMALLADGWHMSTHALALGVSVLAYVAARHWAHDKRFTFGTWKIEILGGFTSALFLVAVAATMLFHSVERLFNPLPIHYTQAVAIAALGLGINLACAWLLHSGKRHHHDQPHAHHHGTAHHSHHEDLNLRAAYLHVLADAATSVLAIVALSGGMLWGAAWLDPIMGIAGCVLVAIWAWGLLRDCARILLDAEMDAPVVDEIREVVAQNAPPLRITDLHVWRVASGKYACIVSVLCSNSTMTAETLRRQLQIHAELVHVTVEINHKQTA